MSIPKVEVLSIEQGATPDLANINKHTQRGRGLHSNSMKKRGAGRSIFSAGKGVAVPVVIGGNQTLEIAAEMGLEIINVHTTGKQIVNVVRDDIAPGSVEAIALGIEDNEIGRVSYAPDLDLLAQMTAGDHALLTMLRKQDDIFNSIVEGIMPQQIDYEAMWEGMPEFKNEYKTAMKCILVYFDSQEAVNNFAELVEQSITEKTRSIWYPKKVTESLKGLVYSES